MTMTANTAWIAILTAPGLAMRETFEGMCDNGDKNAWTQARDFLVDEALEESEHPLAETLSDLLCDIDPEESFHFEHSGITLTLTPVSENGGAPYQVERAMPEAVLTREDGTPVATFHVVDEWNEDEEEPIAIDEAEAHRLASICAKALDSSENSASFKASLSQFDDSTFQIIVSEENGHAYEFAVVSALEHEQGPAEARQRAERIIAGLAFVNFATS